MPIQALAVLLAALWSCWAFAADNPTPETDPRYLQTLGRAALAAKDVAAARTLFEQRIDASEVSRYLDLKGPLREALLLEQLGDNEASAAQWTAAFHLDVHRAILALRIVSEHPERDALVEAAIAHVRRLVAEARAGRSAAIYTTTKGEVRLLEVMDTDEVLRLSRKGEAARYCYVHDLDLTGRVDLPERIQLERCIVGRMRVPAQQLGSLIFRGIALGDVDIGKTWEGEPNKSKTIPPSSLQDLMFREAIFIGHANFAGVAVHGPRAYFPLAVFEGPADFKGAEFFGVTEFRFASFGAGANMKGLRMHKPVYFGGSRYRADTTFTSLYSERDVYFNSTVFEGDVRFDKCEFQRGATFEDARFAKRADFGTSRITGNLNLSRAVFEGPLNVKDIEAGELDALGSWMRGDAWFTDARVRGRTRFSLDEVTRHALREHIDALLPLYRRYQGDEDADEPLTAHSSYGVRSLDDLNARIDGNISFSNTVFGGYTVFEGVGFGAPGASTTASFFNAQFLGETHFERTVWHGLADFTTIFGNEVAWNMAHFHRGLVLDDANVAGRISLTDATFEPDADLSFYGAEIASFQISPDQVASEDGFHRLFYERCARFGPERQDVRVQRLVRDEALDDDAVRRFCYDALQDELIALKDSYGSRAMTVAEDDAWWWSRHHEAMSRIQFGTAVQRVTGVVVDLGLFETCFGWGVRLRNLVFTALGVVLIYAIAYRTLCADTVLAYDGTNRKIRDVPFFGILYVSAQSLMAVNTGWDFGDDDHRFRVLNTSQTMMGVLLITFFVGAYTRMILA